MADILGPGRRIAHAPGPTLAMAAAAWGGAQPVDQGKSVYCVRFSPDAQWCVSGSRDCKMRLWNLVTGEELRSFDHRGWVVCGFFSPDGTTCFSLGGDGAAQGQAGLREWDPKIGRPIRQFALDAAGASSIGWGSFSKDGKLLATASGNDVIVWDVKAGRLVLSFRADE